MAAPTVDKRTLLGLFDVFAIQVDQWIHIPVLVPKRLGRQRDVSAWSPGEFIFMFVGDPKRCDRSAFWFTRGSPVSSLMATTFVAVTVCQTSGAF